MGLFLGYFVLTGGLFYLFFSIYNYIYTSCLCKFLDKDNSNKVIEFLASKKEDSEIFLVMNIVNFFIVSLLSFLIFGSIEGNYFNIFYLIFFFIIFLIASFILHKKMMGGKLYLRIKDLYILDTRLNEIKELINNLESRKKVLTTYDKDDKYRSIGVINEELKDLDLSIKLLKEMYSNIELNYSYKQINDLFSLLKKDGAFTSQDNLSNFQNKVDIMNSRKLLDKNIDVDLEKLKSKYN